ncbi:MAG: PIG-L family deacetylase [Verrucomicrobia bacterium]|nr:PIG-L family deacetylase [Verrucomicrobiota bacterium]
MSGNALRVDAEVLFAWLQKPAALRQSRLMIIVAHPDDEVIGIGSRLPDLRSSMFVHGTTGAAAEEVNYSRQRASELASALRLAGLHPRQLRPLGHADQTLSHRLAELVGELAALVSTEKPQAIFTHPYEGGHPDHDSIAFAVHAACAAVHSPAAVMEIASYHQGRDGIRTGEFLPDGSSPCLTLQLSAEERVLKQQLLDCFESQRETLRYFGTATERFRIAPRYDFTRPPHEGRLFYENFNWGVRSGEQWRSLARNAVAEPTLAPQCH